MAKELPKRSEVKEEYTWDVSAMYASKTAWEADLKEVDAIVSDLAKLEGSVMASAEKLLTALEQMCIRDSEKAYDEAWDKILDEIDEKYQKAEDKYELNDPYFAAVPVNISENFYRNEEEDHDGDGTSDGTVRVYQKTDDINLACLMEGSFPASSDEIVVDRMHADNVGIAVGAVYKRQI